VTLLLLLLSQLLWEFYQYVSPEHFKSILSEIVISECPSRCVIFGSASVEELCLETVATSVNFSKISVEFLMDNLLFTLQMFNFIA
jgi:hypothetical protein